MTNDADTDDDDTPPNLKGFDTDDEGYARHLGTIKDTDVYIVAEGPKARWCADVLSSQFESIFTGIKKLIEAND